MRDNFACLLGKHDDYIIRLLRLEDNCGLLLRLVAAYRKYFTTLAFASVFVEANISIFGLPTGIVKKIHIRIVREYNRIVNTY